MMGNKKFKRIGIIVLSLILIIAAAGCSTKAPAATPDAAQEKASPADKFPEQDIFCTYSSKAGSGGDIFLRNLGKAITGSLNGNTWVVENRTGASGANAWMYVKDAKPDGYNLLGFTTSMISAGIISDMPVSYADFDAVCSIANDPQYIYVKADKPWNSLEDLFADAKARPGKQTWGRGIPSGSNALGQLLLLKAAPDVEISPVVFDGGSEMLTAVLGGHIDVASGEYSEIRGQLDAGELKILAALTSERVSILPEVKTAKEQGYDAVLDRPRGILAPKGTPPEVIQKIADIVKVALEDKAFTSQLEEEGTVVDYKGPAEFKTILDNIYNSYMSINLKELANAQK